MEQRPIFQQRHYEWIARLLAATRPLPYPLTNDYDRWLYIVGVFSSQFMLDNPRFDEAKFHQAVMR